MLSLALYRKITASATTFTPTKSERPVEVHVEFTDAQSPAAHPMGYFSLTPAEADTLADALRSAAASARVAQANRQEPAGG